MNRSSTLCLLFLLLLLLPVLGVAEKQKGRFYGGKETIYPDWFKESFLDLSEDLQDAAESGRRLLIFFHQNGCPYCNLTVERNLSQRDIQQAMRERMDVVAINMFGDREVTAQDGEVMTEKRFAESMKVMFTPTLLFFNEQGEVILRLNGYIPPQQFKLALDYVNNRMERQISYRDYVAQQQPPAPNGQLNAEPYHLSPPFNLQLDVAGPLVVFFEQKQCPDCDRLHREVLSDPEIRELIGNYSAVQLDMWSNTPLVTPSGKRTDARSWAQRLQVSFAPTFILFDADGKEIIRSEAMFKRFHSASMFAYGLDGAYLKEPSFQRFISARSEQIREQGRDVDIWK